jgi:hypothetical protein
MPTQEQIFAQTICVHGAGDNSRTSRKNMKFAIAALLSLFAASAHAETWVETYSSGGVTAYADTDSIKRDGSMASANFKREYNDGVKRVSQDAAGNTFQIAQTRSVMTFDCNGDTRSLGQLVDVSSDGQKQSPAKSYPASRNNGTWDAGAKKAVCK